jgi:hypothetical protein
MMASRNWPNSIYYGKTPEQIKAEWQQGNQLGTLLHDTIERYYNQEILSSQMIDPRIQKEFVFFLQFVVDFGRLNPDWRPYRTEQYVFDEEYQISGAIDMTFVNSKGELWIVDWKRSRQIRKGNEYSVGKLPLSHLENCNFNTYSLQLNLYRRLLERNYGKRIVKMDLLVLHPDNESYVPHSVEFMDAEIDAILAVRLREVKGVREVGGKREVGKVGEVGEAVEVGKVGEVGEVGGEREVKGVSELSSELIGLKI